MGRQRSRYITNWHKEQRLRREKNAYYNKLYDLYDKAWYREFRGTNQPAKLMQCDNLLRYAERKILATL